MKFLYKGQTLATLAIIAITTVACGQNAKVKTVTIINGDTTVSESNLDNKELAKMEKEITIMINDDGKAEKKIVKKVIISGDKDSESNTMAYAYSSDDDKDMKDVDVQISTDENGKKTKIIIKKDNEKEGERTEKRTTVKKMDVSKDDIEKESIDLNISVQNKNAKVEVETGSKEPLNISVLDENGKQIFYDSQKKGGKYSKEIPLGKKGTYFLNIIQNKKSSTEKIIVE